MLTFKLYAPDETTVVDTEVVSVSGNGTYTTPTGYTLPTVGTVTGTFQWVVSYSGDPNNQPATSAMGDEPVAVELASPTISTTSDPTDVILDSSGSPTLTDSATIANGYNPAGTVTFTLYGPDGTTVVDTETVSVTGNGTYNTPTGYTLPTTGAVSGIYQWVASYSGDGNNSAESSVRGDEPVSVAPATPSISTTPTPTDITLDASGSPTLTDSATLTDGYNPTGTITFTLYGPDGTTVVDTETVTVSGNGTYPTPTGYALPSTGTVAGTYQWIASYSGDGNNNSESGALGDEPVTVASASPTLSTTADPTDVTLEASESPVLMDAATLAGGYNPTGTITFKLYAPDGTTVVDTEMTAVNGNGSYSTPTGYSLPASGTVTGTYEWVTSYGGDANNSSAMSGQGDEPVSVRPASPTIGTSANPTTGVVGVTRLQDSATLAGGYSPTGVIIFTLYAADQTTAVYSEGVAAAGNTTVGTTNGWVPIAAGTYYWRASYSGDGNNVGVTSGAGDEPVTIGGGTATISTLIVDAGGSTVIPALRSDAGASGNPTVEALSGGMTIDRNAGAKVRDTANVSGDLPGTTPMGTVTYSFTGTDGTSLAGLAVPAGWSVTPNRLTWTDTEILSDGNVPDSAPTSALPPGSYEFTTRYSGDGNFAPSAGPPEPLTVTDPSGGGAIIVPPGTPCSQVTYDLAHGLGGQSNVTVQVRVAAGAITRHVAPPYVTYYVKFFAPSSSLQIDVNQAPPAPLPPLAALNGHVTLHNGNANLMALPRGSVTITPADVEINVNSLKPGADYYIGIRYSTTNLVGRPWPFGAGATVNDTFKTSLSAGGLVPKSTVNLPIRGSAASVTTRPNIEALRLHRGGTLARTLHAVDHFQSGPGSVAAFSRRSPLRRTAKLGASD
jgi:hypothetical protein